MFLTEDDKRAIALADALKYLKLSREAYNVYDNTCGAVDDEYAQIQEWLEFEQ